MNAPPVLDDDLTAPPEEDLLPPPGEEDPPAAIAGSEIQLQQLVEILPADFPLPALIKFAPDSRFREAADRDAAALLAMRVTDEASKRLVERCVEQQRAHKAAIEALFEEPCAIANRLHKHLTGLRTQWLEQTTAAIGHGNTGVLQMQRQLDRDAAEARRKAQEEADRVAREQADQEAAAARAANAPTEVVQQLEFEAKTATAAPIPKEAFSRGTLRSSSIVPSWKARLTATDRTATEWNPVMASLSIPEQIAVRNAMKAVLDGRLPLVVFEINWSVVNNRAKSDKNTFAMEGFVAEDVGGIRAKPGRRV